MVQRIGTRRKTRALYRKTVKTRGKISLSRFFRTFAEGESVRMVGDSAYQKALPWFRFHGKVGTIMGKQGRCYRVSMSDRGKAKIVIVHPIHLQRIQG